MVASCGHFFAPESLPVPRYYFHWDLGTHRIRDDDGVELADDGTALQRAETERELLMAAFFVERDCNNYGIDVCDTNGRPLVSHRLALTSHAN